MDYINCQCALLDADYSSLVFITWHNPSNFKCGSSLPFRVDRPSGQRVVLIKILFLPTLWPTDDGKS